MVLLQNKTSDTSIRSYICLCCVFISVTDSNLCENIRSSCTKTSAPHDTTCTCKSSNPFMCKLFGQVCLSQVNVQYKSRVFKSVFTALAKHLKKSDKQQPIAIGHPSVFINILTLPTPFLFINEMHIELFDLQACHHRHHHHTPLVDAAVHIQKD